MSLGLDLSASRAKVTRAREQFRVLERELPAHVAKHHPYAVRFSKVDPQTGWCEVWLVPADRAGYHPFGVLFGEVVHNLRCALDYVITLLVQATPTQALTTKHQFPIFWSATRYRNDVGTSTVPKPTGPLQGLSHGIALIESWQPYKLKAQGLNPRTDPLWNIHRFSNADKHREIAPFTPVPFGALECNFKGTKVEDAPIDEIPNFSIDEEFVIHRMRFDPPVATNLRVTSPLTVGLGFSTPPIRS